MMPPPRLRSLFRVCAPLAVVILLAAPRPGLGQPAPADTPTPATALRPEVLGELSWDTSLGALARGWPGLLALRGPARVTVVLQQQGTAVVQVVTLEAPAVRLGDQELGRLRVRLERRPGLPTATLRLDLHGPLAERIEALFEATLEVDVVSGAVAFEGGPLRLRLAAQGVDLEVLSRLWPGLGLVGRADLTADLDGDAATPVGRGLLQVSGLGWRGTALGPLRVAWVHRDHKSGATVTVGDADAPLLAAETVLPLRLDVGRRELSWLDGQPVDVKLTLKGLDAARLRPLWRLPPGSGLLLDGHLRAEGPLRTLALDAAVAGELRGTAHEPLALTARLRAGSRKQTLEVTLGEAAGILRLETSGDLVKLRRRKQRADTVPVSGALTAGLPLEVLGPYLPASLYDPTGTLNAEVTLSGQLGQPSFDGFVRTAGAELTVLPLNVRLSPLDLDLRLRERTLKSETLHARTHGGTCSGSISATLVTAPAPATEAGGPFASFHLSGDGALTLQHFPVVQPGLPVGRANGEVKLRTSLGRAERRLQVLVQGGTVELSARELPEVRALPRRSDGTRDAVAGDGEREADASDVLRVLDLRLTAPVVVTGPDLEVALSGGWTVERQGGLATVQGALELLKGGRFALFDNPFVLERGEVRLPGGRLGADAREAVLGSRSAQVGLARAARSKTRPLEPVVSFVSQGVAVDTSVLVAVHGPAQRPELVLFSSPSLPEYQIMTLLITGRADAVDDRNGEVRRKVASLVDRFDNPSLSRQLYDRIGVDRLGLGFGSSVSQPILTVGKQVTRQLYVETVYHHNAPPTENEKEGHVEYHLNPSWTVDTTYGDAAQGSAGLFWRSDFGGPPPPQVGEDLQAFAAQLQLPEPDSDSDGLADPDDRCPAEPEDPDGFEDEDGCPEPDNDGDGVPDLRDGAPDRAETANGYLDDDGVPDSPPPAIVAVRTTLRPITFERNGADVPEGALPALDALGATLSTLPVAELRVVGHSDTRGAADANLQVSKQRGEQVAALLRRAGVDPERLVVEGMGAQQPLEHDEAPEAQARNRRVELFVTFEGAQPPPSAPPAQP